METLFDPALAEDAVFHGLRQGEQQGIRDLAREYRREIDPLYELPPGDEARERAFREIHARYFRLLGYDRLFERAFAGAGLVGTQIERATILKAHSAREEGAELFVRLEGCGPPNRVERTIVVRLRPPSFLSPDALVPWLRRELYHVRDMIDPAFGYEPALGEASDSPGRVNLLRDRYRVLWDAYIDGRLGLAPESPPETFERAFRSLEPEGRRLLFGRVASARSLSHADLVAIAREPIERGLRIEDRGAENEPPRAALEEVGIPSSPM